MTTGLLLCQDIFIFAPQRCIFTLLGGFKWFADRKYLTFENDNYYLQVTVLKSDFDTALVQLPPNENGMQTVLSVVVGSELFIHQLTTIRFRKVTI
jgi:hypothetical protein